MQLKRISTSEMYLCWCYFATILFVIANGQQDRIYIFRDDEQALAKFIKDNLLDPNHISLRGEDKTKLERIATVIAKRSRGKTYTTNTSVKQFFYRIFSELSVCEKYQRSIVRKKAKEAWEKCAEQIVNNTLC